MSSQTNDMLDFNDGPGDKIPSSLIVLSILSFVGCGISAISAFWSFAMAKKSYQDLQTAQSKMENAPAFLRKMVGPEMLEMARKAMENRMPILLVGLAGVVLCVWGALEMRKLKKQGFLLWVAGEFFPVIANFILLGAGVLAGFALFGLLIPIIFLILYGVNRKHLIY